MARDEARIFDTLLARRKAQEAAMTEAPATPVPNALLSSACVGCGVGLGYMHKPGCPRLASPAPASSEGGGLENPDEPGAPENATDWPAPPAPDRTAKGLDRKAFQTAWAIFLTANPDNLTSPDDLPDHALVTADQAFGIACDALTDHAEASRQLAEANARVAELERQADLAKSGADSWFSWGTKQETRALAAEADAAKVREALKPFADLADKFTGPMVEVCDPHPDNPSRTIQPLAAVHLEAAFQAQTQRGA